MKIQANKPMKNYDGKDLMESEKEVLTIGHAISAILSSAEQGGKMKIFVLAQKFFTEKEVEIDNADVDLIEKIIEASKGFKAVVTGQLLLMFSELKEKKEFPQENQNNTMGRKIGRNK